MITRTILCASLVVAPLLGACDTQLHIAVSGASTMRIDVEVYKGPLSKDPWTQYGELVGLLEAMNHSFNKVRWLTELYDVERNCVPGLTTTQELLRAESSATAKGDSQRALQNIRAVAGRGANCVLLGSVTADLDHLARNRVFEVSYPDNACDPVNHTKCISEHLDRANAAKMRDYLARLSALASWLKTKALFWEGAHVALRPEDELLRNAIINFASLAAEYSNQINTRADALLWQMDGHDRRELPLSVHLRDTKPTDFLNLYVWDKAAVSGVAIPPKRGLQAGWYEMGAEAKEPATDRVRALERLYADHYWSRINTAYASGQGDVAMAFIKDDIGNWNLKSFDNDPSDLLRAYTGVAKAALKAAIDAAASPTGAPAAMRLTDLANRVTTGRSTLVVPATAGGFDIKELHQRALRDLQNHKKATSDGQAKYVADLEVAKKAVSDTANGTEEEKQAAKDRQQAAQAALTKYSTDALARTAEILNTHATIVDILQEGATRNSATKELGTDTPVGAATPASPPVDPGIRPGAPLAPPATSN